MSRPEVLLSVGVPGSPQRSEDGTDPNKARDRAEDYRKTSVRNDAFLQEHFQLPADGVATTIWYASAPERKRLAENDQLSEWSRYANLFHGAGLACICLRKEVEYQHCVQVNNFLYSLIMERLKHG